MSSLSDIAGRFKPRPKQMKTLKPSLCAGFNQAAGATAYDWAGKLCSWTNCYTYALNQPQVGWGIPGELTEQHGDRRKYRLYNPDDLRVSLVEFDKLIQITEAQALSGRFHAIALRISPEDDFHFFRREIDGMWTHKNGGDTPRNKDDLGQTIRNPRACYDQRYRLFGGFYMIPEQGVPFI